MSNIVDAPVEPTPDVPTPEVPAEPAAQAHAALYEALAGCIADTAQALSLPLGMEGKRFAPPVGTHLRGKVVITDSAAASLGPAAPLRVDGALEITVCAKAGLGLSAAMATAQTVLRRLPRGTSVPAQGADCVLLAGTPRPDGTQADRARVLVSIPFYAFVQA